MRAEAALRILGLDRGATKEEVKAAYHKLALKKHPDLVDTALKAEAEANFKQIAEAYTSLSTSQASYRVGKSFGPSRGIRRGSFAYYGLGSIPFVLIIGTTLFLGGMRLSSAYKQSKKDSLSRNPFLP